MALNDFNDNLNIVSQLADQPNLAASALKAKFDEAGNAIQTWVNGTLVPFVNGLADGSNLGTKVVKTAALDDGSVTTAKIADANITSAKLDLQTKIVLSGSAIYGTQTDMNNVSNPVVGQIFFKKVT